ncbi:ExeM/NucH family extracellular endonuclease [Vibrio tapetis subsp. quintayensis]|uniref:ExeM/NucH family extracellular endonuclease n=1 Tax=Vibrio tapetis TaxID=52443 RepID=UPI0025B53207|nr:ExeM/NucH family extracellular endonuclease [Vibrio tapetis]MDN3679405.1 ExeM/NucH family extracellular endonuclease [Vibrio tapetis subsp. quintayensis]
MNKKMTVLAGAITSILSASALADINDIIISEYMEGGYNNKAVEITNLGASDFVFPSNIDIAYQKDGATWTRIDLDDGSSALSGITLSAGKSLVLRNPSSSSNEQAQIDALESAKSKFGAQVVNAKVYYNGNDAVALRDVSNSSAPVLLDVIGVIGSSSNWGKDVTLRRYNANKAQSATYKSDSWLQEAKNTFSGLGDPALAPQSVAATPCTDAEGSISHKMIGEVQGEGYSSPLITSGYTSTDEYLVTGVVSAVSKTLLKGGFFLFDADADGNAKTSDGVFVKTSAPVSQDMVGQQICVRAKVKEDYGVTMLVPTDNKWEVKNASVVIPTPVELVRISSDGDTFRSTLERYEGMPVKLVKDMDSVAEDDQNMRVSRTFGYDYGSRRNNMVVAYKRPNMQPNQEHAAGSAESKAQKSQNNDYRLIVDTDEAPGNGVVPFYPTFSYDNHIRIDDSVIGLEGVIHYSYGDFRMMVTNTVDKNAFIHNTPRQAKPKISTSTTNDRFAIKIATQNVLNYFNSPFGGDTNTHGENRGAENQEDFDRQQAKIVEAIYGLNADIVGLMEVENNGFGDRSAIKELLNAVNAKFSDDRYSNRNNQNSIHNRYTFVGFDSNGDTVLDALDSVGGDAITTGLFYRPSKVSLKAGKVIPMPSQIGDPVVDDSGQPIVKSNGEMVESGRNYQRDSIAATFQVLNTGKEVTVAVNHLKSKGSTCNDDWAGWQEWTSFDPKKGKVKDDDYQGSCENFRVAAAYQLGEQLAKMGGDQVVVGDMNSYANEDPMLVLTSNPTGKVLKAAANTFIGKKPQFGADGAVITKTYGFINAVGKKDAEHGKQSWSYSYNDEVGSLDHVLISKSLDSRMIDAVDWHINAAESTLFDYQGKYKDNDNDTNLNPFYEKTAFRSSDHDSALISLSYRYAEAGENRVTVAVKSDRMEIPFPINISASTELGGEDLPKAGDIAQLVISPMPDHPVAVPTVKLTKSGNQTIKFDVVGFKAGDYTFSVKLTGERWVNEAGEVVVAPAVQTMASSVEPVKKTITIPKTDSLVSVKVVKRDSLTPSIAIPEYDGTGGSGGAFGLGGLFALFGFGFLRRRRQ